MHSGEDTYVPLYLMYAYFHTTGSAAFYTVGLMKYPTAFPTLMFELLQLCVSTCHRNFFSKMRIGNPVVAQHGPGQT